MSTQPLLQRTANKRIALPVRVEPKVAFANERTFLSWLHFTVVLGGLAVGLLNFGDKIGKISAGMFSIVGMFPLLHSCRCAIVLAGSGVSQMASILICFALFQLWR